MSFYTIPEIVLRLLDSMAYDPNAKSAYCMFSDGLHWSDEFPNSQASPDAEALWRDYLPRHLIHVRASLTLGEAQQGQLALWSQVERGAPNWPGLRPERRGPKARRQLLAAKRRADACIAQWERELDDPPQAGGTQ